MAAAFLDGPERWPAGSRTVAAQRSRREGAFYDGAFRDHALALPGTTEVLPFGPDALVFRVGGKVSILLALDAAIVTLACSPERAVEVHERDADVRPGYLMAP